MLVIGAVCNQFKFTKCCSNNCVQVLSGTFFFRGYVYARSMELQEGWVCSAQDFLLFRPQIFDTKQSTDLCLVLDPLSLQVFHLFQLSFLQLVMISIRPHYLRRSWTDQMNVDPSK